MAIGRGAARLLVLESARAGYRGRLLQLGPQRLYLRHGELRAYAAEAGLTLPPELDSVPAHEPVGTERFFTALGFDAVESCDLHDVTATHRLDLNEEVPAELRARFDAVLDGGTMEHVFDTRRVLANIHDLLAEGGLAIHLAPANNWVDHGFYSFSPMFFTSYYGANGYHVEAAWLLRHSRRWQRGTWLAIPYAPGSIARRADGGFEKGMMLNFVMARRGPHATTGAVPQQDFTPPAPRQGSGLRGMAARIAPLRRLVRNLAPDRLPSDVVTIVPRRRPAGARRL